jgi:hypothetical protein
LGLLRSESLASERIPGFGVALGWLWGAYQLAINRLCGGFDVALGGFAGHGFRAFKNA